MSLAIVFPGQGSQSVGMMKGFADAPEVEQTFREATAIAPYSTRARPGASVAMPLSWQELGSLKAANAFTVLNIDKRLARLRGDPWQEMGRLKQRLPRT